VQIYDLVIQVSDGRYEAQTRVKITLIDMNDNVPVFYPSVYLVTEGVEEEDSSITSTNRLPLVQVMEMPEYLDNWSSLSSHWSPISTGSVFRLVIVFVSLKGLCE